MTDRRFRFGVVAAQADSVEKWGELVRRVDDLGFDTLLTPDTFNCTAPFTALGSAAMASPRLRLGTFVLATPLRTPASIAWEAASIDRLSGGRFELGLGAGRPDAEGEARLLGVPWGSGGQRVEQVARAITDVRSVFATALESGRDAGPAAPNDYLRPTQTPGPPIMVAGAGPKLLALAAREADIVGVAVPGAGGDEELADRVRIVREAAGDRFDRLELSVNVFSVGRGDLPEWMRARFGVEPEQARDNRAVAVLTGDPRTVADVLLRRRDEYGISYVTVNGAAMEAFGPVLELLSGH